MLVWNGQTVYFYDDDAAEEDKADDVLFAAVFKDHAYTLGDSEMESECTVGSLYALCSNGVHIPIEAWGEIHS